MIIHLVAELIRKILFYKMSYFPKPYDHSRNKIKVYLYLPNYKTKSDLKNATGVENLPS